MDSSSPSISAKRVTETLFTETLGLLLLKEKVCTHDRLISLKDIERRDERK